jgi:hypothetical protein
VNGLFREWVDRRGRVDFVEKIEDCVLAGNVQLHIEFCLSSVNNKAAEQEISRLRRHPEVNQEAEQVRKVTVDVANNVHVTAQLQKIRLRVEDRIQELADLEDRLPIDRWELEKRRVLDNVIDVAPAYVLDDRQHNRKAVRAYLASTEKRVTVRF